MTRFLIVEDSIHMRYMIKRLLENMGYNVIGEAENTISALMYCHEYKPEIILLDLILPGKSGFEIIDEIRKINNSSKILVVTAVNQTDLDRQLSEKKCSILKKPFTKEEFEEAIKNTIQKD